MRLLVVSAQGSDEEHESHAIPQLFALAHQVDEARQIVAYGMVLPDGSAISVAWPAEGGTSYYSTRSAERAAVLCDADLLWIADLT